MGAIVLLALPALLQAPSADQVWARIQSRIRALNSVSGTVTKENYPKQPQPPTRFVFQVEKVGRYAFESSTISTHFDGNRYYYADSSQSLYYRFDATDAQGAFAKRPSLRSVLAFNGLIPSLETKPTRVSFVTWEGKRRLAVDYPPESAFTKGIHALYDVQTLWPVAVEESDALSRIVYRYAGLQANPSAIKVTFGWKPPAGYRRSQYEREALLPVGSNAPALSVKSPSGSKLSLKDTFKKNKVTVLEFWFYHCPPCRDAFPHLQKLWKATDSQGLGIVAVNYSDNAAVAQKYFTREGLTIPIALSGIVPNDDLVTAYKVTAYPTTYLIDQNGKVLDRFVGVNSPETYSQFISVIESAGILVPAEVAKISKG